MWYKKEVNETPLSGLFVTKYCSGCKQTKPLDGFVPDKRKRLGVTPLCRECRNAKARAIRKKHPERYRSYGWGYEQQREYRLANVEKSREYSKKWRAKSRHKISAAERRRRQTDPQHRIKMNLRSRFNDALARVGAGKKSSVVKYLGCTIDEFRKYIASLFVDGMTWENYGRGSGKWCIDHIVPCCSFDLLTERGQADCFHYTNLRPLWFDENIAKASTDKRRSLR